MSTAAIWRRLTATMRDHVRRRGQQLPRVDVDEDPTGPQHVTLRDLLVMRGAITPAGTAPTIEPTTTRAASCTPSTTMPPDGGARCET